MMTVSLDCFDEDQAEKIVSLLKSINDSVMPVEMTGT